MPTFASMKQRSRAALAALLVPGALLISAMALGATGDEGTASDSALDAVPSTARLQRLAPDLTVDTPESTPVDGIFRVRVGGGYVYLTGDGRHAFTGDLLDLVTGENLTEARRNGDRLAAVAAFPDAELLVLPAEGEERARIHVFTDSTCPYCRKLHQEAPALRDAGVTIAYIPFPRGGPGGPGYQDLRSVWCADDPAKAFDIAAGTADGQLATAQSDCVAAKAVDAGFRLGAGLGIQGTPTIVLPSGAELPGYLETPKLLKQLGLQQDRTAGASAGPK